MAKIKNEKINMQNIYIGVETKEEYFEELGGNDYSQGVVLLEKQNYYLKCDSVNVQIYKNIVSQEQVAVRNDGSVFEIKEKDYYVEKEHYIELIEKVTDIIKIVEQEELMEPGYKTIVNSSYKKIKKSLKRKEISQEELINISEDLINLYYYQLIINNIDDEEELETEEEKEENKVLDFNTYKQLIRKKQ